MKEDQKTEEVKEPTFPQILSESGGIHKIFTKEKGMYIFISPGNPTLEDLDEVTDFLSSVIKKSIEQREEKEKEEFKKVDDKEITKETK